MAITRADDNLTHKEGKQAGPRGSDPTPSCPEGCQDIKVGDASSERQLVRDPGAKLARDGGFNCRPNGWR